MTIDEGRSWEGEIPLKGEDLPDGDESAEIETCL